MLSVLLSLFILSGAVAVIALLPTNPSFLEALPWPRQPTRSILIFVCGCIFPYAARYAITLIFFNKKSSNRDGQQGSDSQIYGLDHGVLNLQVPPPTWWMNMGYWKDQPVPRDLPAACQALLDEVLSAAGIISNSDGAGSSVSDNVHIIDVGFGCGDQTIAITRLSNIRSYVGITVDRKQYRFAKERLLKLGLLAGSASDGKPTSTPDVQIYCTDAAKPESWETALREAAARTTPSLSMHSGAKSGLSSDTWLLGLDTLYHFSPSRLPLFHYASRDLKASIVAFDLLLSEDYHSPVRRLILRFICLLSSTPYTNLLTPTDYQAQLVEAGYRKKDINITDISEHVFESLVDFLEGQDQQLKVLGKGIGPFHVAKWMFKWWVKTGIVRGCIVVARRRDQYSSDVPKQDTRDTED